MVRVQIFIPEPRGGGAIFRTRRKSNGMKIGVLAWSSLHHSIDTISIYDHSLSMPAPGHEAFHEGRMEKQAGLLLLSKVSLTYGGPRGRAMR